jgi:hypothetical protein
MLFGFIVVVVNIAWFADESDVGVGVGVVDVGDCDNGGGGGCVVDGGGDDCDASDGV